MPFLNRRDMALKTRVQAEKDYRTQLRAALSTPGLPAAQRIEIQRRLKQVGRPRVYDAESLPLPGAINLTPNLIEADLVALKKTDLVTRAKERGVPTSGSKATLIKRLLIK